MTAPDPARVRVRNAILEEAIRAIERPVRSVDARKPLTVVQARSEFLRRLRALKTSPAGDVR